MTNWERWLKYTESLPSPDNFIHWGGLFWVSAALQRRVWAPPDWRRCYANIFVTTVAKPGVGKGQVIKCIGEILTHWKKGDVTQNVSPKNPSDQEILNRMIEINNKEKEEMLNGTKKEGQGYKDDYLFPGAPNAVTYEELVRRMAKSVDRHNYYYTDETDGKEKMGVHSHCSMYSLLEEMASLFRKNTESTVNFLLEAYDSNENYEYATKNNGYDRIRRMCLAFFAGTTPDFMQQCFDDKLTSQGYSSRQFFVYAARNRKPVGFMEKQTAEQKECLRELREHARKLATLYGQVTVAPELQAWFNDLIKQRFENPSMRVSKSPKLDAYYERWNIHVIKVALCWHFLNNTTMELTREDFDWAIAFLAETEKTMHYALVLEGTNPLAKLTKTIQSFLAVAGPQSFIDLLMEFHGSATKADLEDALTMLQDIRQVETEQRRDGADEPLLYYKIRR